MTLDEIRATYPHLGLALYALEPGGPVVLEVHAPGFLQTWRGQTVQAVVDQAFPPEVEPPAPSPVVDVLS